ncbi:MAG: hypothetical protein LBC74_12675 [Planctomycetaceae bacterium]|nr:hypothetical protein [Planctomycetaceae bacterium]
MKRNLQKMSYGRVVSLIGIFVLSFGLFGNQLQQIQAAPSQANQSQIRCKEHNLKGCASCIGDGVSAEMHYEFVPHVVLPETIQYNRVTPKSNNTAANAGTVSPFVATYIAFPSYNLPVNTEFRQINQLTYPITPKILPLPLPLPQKNANKDENKDQNKRNEKRSVENQLEKDKIDKQNDLFETKQPSNQNQIFSKIVSKQKSGNNTYDHSVADEMFDMSMAILQVSSTEEIVPATPRFALNDNVTQTGIFCNSTPKTPVAWSFSSPIFKIAAVPAGVGNNSYISQFNPHGGVNIGFQPSPNSQGQPQLGAYPPFPPNPVPNNGANVQVLPNGMLLLTAPPSHHNCGLLRCRDHNWRYMLLPPAPNQFQNTPPQPTTQPPLPPATPTTSMIDPQTQALMYPYMPPMNPYANPYSPQQQIMPITAMTPYGMTVVGYRQMPQLPMTDYGMLGSGNFMNIAYNQQLGQQLPPLQMQFAQQQFAQQQLAQQQLAQQQLAQQKLLQQHLLAKQNNSDTQTQDTTGKDNAEESSDLKMPLPINGIANGAVTGNANQNTLPMGLYANPYAMYALQSGNLATGTNNTVGETGAGISGEQPVGISTAQSNPQFNTLSNPYLANYPMMVLPQQFGMYGSPYGFNPYSTPVYPAAQFGGQFGNQFLSPWSQPYMPVGLQQQLPQQQMNQGNGLTMSDVLLLMILMKENNKPQRRLTFFERIAERRAARRQRAEQNDPFNQIMQMWSTPFYTDNTARMPASTAYPYGYFGAQPAPINTANYGGYHNLYYGNTTY